jgi:hypothetical protein
MPIFMRAMRVGWPLIASGKRMSGEHTHTLERFASHHPVT